MQRMEYTNERRLVCHSARQDRHRTMIRIAHLLGQPALLVPFPRARESLPEVYLEALGSLALIIALASERLREQEDLTS